MTSIEDLVGHEYGNGGNGSEKEESQTSTSNCDSGDGGDDRNCKVRNENQNNNNKISVIINVSDALRLHSGFVQVQGMITSLSELYKMITAIIFVCGNCGWSSEEKYEIPLSTSQQVKYPKQCPSCGEKYFSARCEYVSAVTVELQDIDTFSEIERLPVLLFDENTKNIHVGERVIASGKIHIIQHKPRGKSLPFVYADLIKYESREEVSLTSNDIEAIERFCKRNGSKVIEKLVPMFAPSVIGYDYVKEGLLLCAANTNTNDTGQRNRDRMHAILVGDTGLAKSSLLREATKLVLNSKYESGQNSSGKSLTAIVIKEDENYVLRLGPASLARGTFCAVNELGRIQYEEQAYLLDLMEEGQFTINKHGINARIKTPTTIIASANPINGNWKDDEKIDLNEIPALKPLIDRFDLLFIFRKPKNPQDIRQYAYRKSELHDKKVPDYNNFLRKYILYVKTKVNPILSEEAKAMLSEYWIQLATRFGSLRVLETLFRLAKARARLKLKKIADVEEARETMEFYNVIFQQHQQAVSLPTSPRDVTYNECVNVLKESRLAVTFEELVKSACKRNEHVNRYIGCKFKLQDNIRLRPILSMLLNHSCIKQIQDKPVVLQWIENVTDGGLSVFARGSSDSSNSSNLSDAYDAYDTQTDSIDKKNLLSQLSVGMQAKENLNHCQQQPPNTDTKKPKPRQINNNNDNRTLEENSNNSHHQSPTGTSYISYTSDSNKQQVEDFFYDNSSLPWQPLPAHNLEESPCYPIIGIHKKYGGYILFQNKESACGYIYTVLRWRNRKSRRSNITPKRHWGSLRRYLT